MSAQPKQTAATMQAGTAANLSVRWFDSAGNQAPVEGLVSWISSNPLIARLTPDPANHSQCLVYAPGRVGDALVEATTDAQIGEGVRVISAIITISVISGQEVGWEIRFRKA